MTNFKEAYDRTNLREGLYDYNPSDPGGETFGGISRVNYPNWPGWMLIDGYKKKPNFLSLIKSDIVLQKMKSDFYQNEYWSKLPCDKLVSQILANEVYDCAINMGLVVSIKILQKALNLLSGSTLHEDGDFGPKTQAVFDSYISTVSHINQARALLAVMLCLRAERYIYIDTQNTKNDIFFKGWIYRILKSVSW